MPIFLSIPVFFTIRPRNNKMPSKGFNYQKANKKKLDKSNKKLLNSKGEIIENLDIFKEFLTSAVSSNANFKIGHLIAGIVDHTVNSIIHDDNTQLPIIHHNDRNIMPNSEVTIERTFVYLGTNYSGKIKAYLRGPVYEILEKSLVDSQRDWMKTADRKNLEAKSGINQRGTVFLESGTFLTLKDVEELSNHKKHSSKIQKELKSIYEKFQIDQQIDNLIEKSPKSQELKDLKDIITKLGVKSNEKDKSISKPILNLKNLTKRIGDRSFSRYYSALLEIKTQLKIINRMPVYNANVAVHLVKLKNFDSHILTVKDLVNDMCLVNENNISTINKNNLFLERIEEKEIYQQIFPSENDIKFKRQINTSLKINPTNVEAFKNNCIVVKTWERRLKSGGHWYINIHERLGNGIYLNRLEEVKNRKAPDDMPVNHFLMVEFFGDNRASVLRNQDEQTISSVYSPCLLNFEYKMNIKHLGNPETPDDLLCYPKIRNSKEFEDESIGLDFYPNREDNFNINYEDIKIGNEKNKKNSKFKLELNSSILENQQLTQIDQLINRMSEIDPDLANATSNDDKPFINDLDTDEDENGRSNLRKPEESEEI